ncbi:MAG: nucleotidyltransferase [Francisellaceae bacterium]|jgi:nucleotidyltransferase substrate binding protein (TIGR01987 family)|nr:nucleotidyltransferase [Francisellaceae bacterium]MBT6207333.1 nucleotidyltransferase [Francisellaceae bacterium]MBT6538680.1 nucleotidyltransferase [Francisellaceae bacterium]
MLNLSSLKKALLQIEKSLQYCNSELAVNDLEILKQFKSASIQAFEYTFELSIKMLKRQLKEMGMAAEEVDFFNYKDLIRAGAEKGLLEEPTLWFKYRDRRNITSHTYNESKADEVYEILPNFVESVIFFISRLESYKE